MLTRNTVARRRQSGLSLVELLVGVTVGIFIVGGAIAMFVANLQNSRKMLLEARLMQDLRAAADVVARDLRRGGYWENSIASTITNAGGLATTFNPNAEVTPDASSSRITYSVARDSVSSRSAANNIKEDDENFGFRLNSGKLQMKIGAGADVNAGWQDLTDSSIVTINNFAITPTVTQLDVPDACANACAGTGCPKVFVRSYLLQLRGTAASDSNVTRVLQERVRVRNDLIAGACPA